MHSLNTETIYVEKQNVTFKLSSSLLTTKSLCGIVCIFLSVQRSFSVVELLTNGSSHAGNGSKVQLCGSIFICLSVACEVFLIVCETERVVLPPYQYSGMLQMFVCSCRVIHSVLNHSPSGSFSTPVTSGLQSHPSGHHWLRSDQTT